MNRIVDYTELKLLNPVTSGSLDILFGEIDSCSTEFIIIDTGDHDFTGIEVMREFKRRFYDNREKYGKFTKIAFLLPEGYMNKSDDPDRYYFFTDRNNAIKWFGEREIK